MSNDPKLLKDLQDHDYPTIQGSSRSVLHPKELGIKQKHFQQISKLLYDSKDDLSRTA